MKNKRVFSGVLLAVIGALFTLSIVGCDNATTPTTQHTVTFDANGGQLSPNTETVEEGKKLSPLPIPTKESGEDTFFQGWYTNNDWGTPFTVLTPITTDITVHAKWGSALPTKHTVTFNPDGGVVSPTSVQVNSGDPVGSLHVPTKGGNTFGGWWTALNGGGTQFFETTIVTGDITVYAKWTRINNTKPDIFPENWKTLDYAGWQTWVNNLDTEMTQETREITQQFLEQHFSEMTEGGQRFWEELMIGGNETPEIHRGTWKKGNITLVIEASQLTISGANWNEINTTFQIERIRQTLDGSIEYYFPPYGIKCRLQNDNLIILEGSGPDELHGTWTSYERRT